MAANEVRQLGRAKNAILEFFERRISVPKIYIDAVWAGTSVDVLAIDRDGVGDVHAVLIFAAKHRSGEEQTAAFDVKIRSVMDRFREIPAQFKYIGVVDATEGGSAGITGMTQDVLEDAYAPDGLGRIGYLSVDFLTPDPVVRLVYKPERFRAKIAALADEYVQKHSADWEIRA